MKLPPDAKASITFESIPGKPDNYSFVYIRALTKKDAQDEIDSLFASVESEGGWASFIHPRRLDNLYIAYGVMRLNPNPRALQ